MLVTHVRGRPLGEERPLRLRPSDRKFCLKMLWEVSRVRAAMSPVVAPESDYIGPEKDGILE